jgi:hypothetical protein
MKQRTKYEEEIYYIHIRKKQLTTNEFCEELEKHLTKYHPEIILGDWTDNMVNHKLSHNI